MERTWTATDNCGNSESFTQTIVVNDDVDPVLVGVPAGVTVECSVNLSSPSVTATDNCECGTVAVVESEALTPGSCADASVLVRSWTATDCSGNTSADSQTIIIQDTQSPSLHSLPL